MAHRNWMLPFVCLIYYSDAKLQIHPRFTSDGKMSFTGAAAYTASPSDGKSIAFWYPNQQTALYHFGQPSSRTPYHVNNGVEICVTITNLAVNEAFTMKFKYKCHPRDTESVQTFQYPFQLGSFREICQSKLSMYIQGARFDWVSNTTYHIHFKLASRMPSQVTLNETLTHYARIQLEFIGETWQLQSNGLYIRNWDPIMSFHKDRIGNQKPARFYLTEDAFQMITNFSFDSYSGFETKPFLDPDIVHLIRNAPEFVQATLFIGAAVSFESAKERFFSDRCYGKHALTYISNDYMFLAEDAENVTARYARLNALTGNITFSRYGLASLVRRRYSPTGPHSICWRSSSPMLYRGYQNGIREDLSPRGSPYPGVASVPEPANECLLLESNPSRRTIFARVGPSFIQCPILCTSPNQKYRFYKDQVLLHPNPNAAGPTTGIGGIELYKSGATLFIQDKVTHADAGTYRCTAGGMEATIIVDVVGLPEFSYPKTELVGGELPPILYASIGGGYSVKCTVFHFGLRSVTLTPEFYVIFDKKQPRWTRLTASEFLEHVEFFNATGSIKITNNAVNKTLELTITGVPSPSDSFDFDHRFVCNATASPEDMQRFGLPEYSVQSESDVIVVPSPAPRDIELSMSPCCRLCCIYGCYAKNCLLIYSLKPEVLAHLKAAGIETQGTFAGYGANATSVTYDKEKGTLSYNLGTGLNGKTKEELADFYKLVPVFQYFGRSSNGTIIISPPLAVIGKGGSGSDMQHRLRSGPCYEDPTLRGASKVRLKWNAMPTLGLPAGRDPHPNGGASLYTGSRGSSPSSRFQRS